MVRLQSGLVAGEYEALQTSDQGDSTRQPPAVPNDQERVTALEQQVEEVDDKVALTAFMGGLQTSKFLFSLSKEAPTSMTELMVRAWKHMNAEDAMNARKNKDGEDKRSEKKRLAPNTREEKESKYKKFSNNQIQDDASLKWPPKLKANPTKRSLSKYCRFHRDHGHNTEDCFDLKNQIENLVRKGHLRKFTTGNGKGGSNPAREGRDDRPPQHQPMGEIKVISGGFAGSGETSSARRAHARSIRSFSEVNEVGMTSPPTKLPRVEEPVITFSEEDDKGIHQPHDDPLGIQEIENWPREAPTHEITTGGIFRR
ncbi:uncharacterized protein LOC132301465 [Cornus florida]|uniref:uncharacterized protein LOC132301465 n=1 Tax=Cornus florida TaxID=4283 RepID=UPI00289B3B7C|nr:uncharacterized protein LOC132301465 [Cornus florida]